MKGGLISECRRPRGRIAGRELRRKKTWGKGRTGDCLRRAKEEKYNKGEPRVKEQGRGI